jgi:hypothetical protein
MEPERKHTWKNPARERRYKAVCAASLPYIKLSYLSYKFLLFYIILYWLDIPQQRAGYHLVNVGYGSLGSMDFSECGLFMLRLSSRVSLGIIKDIISSTLKVN